MDRPIVDGFISLFSSGWAVFNAILGTTIGLLTGSTLGLTASVAISMITPLSFIWSRFPL